MQQSRPFFKSEILSLLKVLDTHLAPSTSGYISPHGYSYVDMGWVVYSDHCVQKGVGFSLDEFENVKAWHGRIYEREGVRKAYEKLGIRHEEVVEG
jgi:glutathione S-transferase